MEKPFELNQHKEWLQQITGTAIPETRSAKAASKLIGDIPTESLVVANIKTISNLDVIKQPIIPLIPIDSEDESSVKAKKVLRDLQDILNDESAFLALIKDKAFGNEAGLTLSIICPKDLLLTEDRLKPQMDACWMAGKETHALTTRAALLTITGKDSP